MTKASFRRYDREPSRGELNTLTDRHTVSADKHMQMDRPCKLKLRWTALNLVCCRYTKLIGGLKSALVSRTVNFIQGCPQKHTSCCQLYPQPLTLLLKDKLVWMKTTFPNEQTSGTRSGILNEWLHDSDNKCSLLPSSSQWSLLTQPWICELRRNECLKSRSSYRAARLDNCGRRCNQPWLCNTWHLVKCTAPTNWGCTVGQPWCISCA